jgi:CheY-like chemotaxis protein
MEAVGQLTGGVAHDFNNLLAVISGNLQMLQRRMDRAELGALHRYVEAATEGISRASALTQRLLAFSRQQPLAPKPLDVNKLVSSMSELLRRTIGEHIHFETVLAGGVWTTYADPNQLESALLNLAVNARDAMPSGGKLTIETANTHLDDSYARANVGVSVGQYVLIAVSDTGSGMPDDVLARAFDPFFTTKPVGQGTGLGLSQVYGFVRQTGGHVKIYTEENQGTTIKIYLPRFKGTPAALERVTAIETAPPSKGETILVVEDDEALRAVAVESLSELGYKVLEASDGTSALAALDQEPLIDVLFTDVVMPGLNGRRLSEEAVRRNERLKVLFTSGYTRNAIIHGGIVDDGVELLQKPYTIEQLASKLRELLDE